MSMLKSTADMSIAAYLGHTHVLAAALHASPAALMTSDETGSTLLHWAVAGGQVLTVKYLIGRWGADSLLSVVDDAGNTPLHRYCGPPSILVILSLGGLHKPPLDAKNHKRQAPIDAMADTQGCSVQEAQEACDRVLASARANALRESPATKRFGSTSSRETCSVLSFLRASPVRSPPRRVRPTPWMSRLRARHWFVGILPLAILLVAALLPLHSFLTRLLPALLCATAFASWRCGGFGRALRTYARAMLDECGTALSILVLCGILLLLGLQNSLGLPTERQHAPIVVAAHLVLQLVVCAAYVAVVVCDPGFVPGGADADNALYWQAYEATPVTAPAAPAGSSAPPGTELNRRRPAPSSPALHGSIIEVPGFCDRSELALRPRARYSPFTQGMVRVMDHDCPFIGTAIGEGNHLSFILLLASAFGSVFTGVTLALLDPPPWTHNWQDTQLHDALRTRLFWLAVLLGLGTLGPLSFLLYSQCDGVFTNVTTIEAMGQAPSSTRARLDEGSPYRNALAFLHRRRERASGSAAAWEDPSTLVFV